MFKNLFSQPKALTITIVAKDLKLYANYCDLAVRYSKKYEQIVFPDTNVSTIMITEKDLASLVNELYRRGLELRKYEKDSIMTYQLHKKA